MRGMQNNYEDREKKGSYLRLGFRMDQGAEAGMDLRWWKHSEEIRWSLD